MSWFWPSHWKIWSNWCLKFKKKWPFFGRITILKNITHMVNLTSHNSKTFASITSGFPCFYHIWVKFFKIVILPKTGHFFFNFKHQLLHIFQWDGLSYSSAYGLVLWRSQFSLYFLNITVTCYIWVKFFRMDILPNECHFFFNFKH